MKIEEVFNKKNNGVYVILEMANAHDGSAQIAGQIVDAAADAGADAIKFQLFTADELAVPDFSYYELYKKLQMPLETWKGLVKHAKDKGLDVLFDVFGLESANTAFDLNAAGIKVHNADISNYELLRSIAKMKLPVILSCGGSYVSEIHKAMDILKKNGTDKIMLMFGIQSYPTQPEDSFLAKIQLLNDEFSVPVGFAPHLEGGSQEAVLVPGLAVAAGAKAVEVHLTLDRSKKLPDYFSSLEPGELKQMLSAVNMASKSRGERSLELSKKETEYRQKHKKFLTASESIKAGEKISYKNVALKRINDSGEDNLTEIDPFIGKTAVAAIEKYSPVKRKDLK
ncbi:MAG: N-acetylneuraminate synthase family protein [Candidatus Margulisiibacteriota bacterium]